jgi:hypothetical protein
MKLIILRDSVKVGNSNSFIIERAGKEIAAIVPLEDYRRLDNNGSPGHILKLIKYKINDELLFLTK